MLIVSACGTDQTAGEAPTEATATCTDVDLAEAPAEPTTLRFAHGQAAEEPFWLMFEDPEATIHKGTWYEMEGMSFRGVEEEMTAFQAGQVDASVVNPFALIRGTATEAIDIVPIITIMRDGEPGSFSTTMITLEDSDIHSIDDLDGATIAINDTGSLPDVLARAALTDAGLDPDRDVTFIMAPFPTQEDVLREGQADVVIVPEPFYTMAHSGGDIRDIANSESIMGHAFDLLVMGFDRDFVHENLGAVCAFRDDYAIAVESYGSDLERARSILAATDRVPLPEDIYQQTQDYARPERGRIDLDGLEQFMERVIELGLLDEDLRITPQDLIIPDISAGH